MEPQTIQQCGPGVLVCHLWRMLFRQISQQEPRHALATYHLCVAIFVVFLAADGRYFKGKCLWVLCTDYFQGSYLILINKIANQQHQRINRCAGR
jgi:hypothetical protein